MKLLALDSSTEFCSVALWIDGAVRERGEIAPRRHAQLLLPWAQELLAEAGIALGALDGVAFGRGPGSFTGVRIATGVVQGIAFGADLPVAPVSTLAALAQAELERHERVAAAIDARMGEVYWGCYRRGAGGLAEEASAEAVAAPGEVVLPEGAGWFGVGSGWGAYGELLGERLGDRLGGSEAERFPQAREVARLGAARLADGGGLPAERALPVYLRDQVAWQKS